MPRLFTLSSLFVLVGLFSNPSAQANRDGLNQPAAAVDDRILKDRLGDLTLAARYYDYRRRPDDRNDSMQILERQTAVFLDRFRLARDSGASEITNTALWVSTREVRYASHRTFQPHLVMDSPRGVYWIEPRAPLLSFQADADGLRSIKSPAFFLEKGLVLSQPNNGYTLILETPGASRTHDGSVEDSLYLTIAQPIERAFDRKDRLPLVNSVVGPIGPEGFSAALLTEVERYPGLRLALEILLQKNELKPDSVEFMNLWVQLIARDYRDELNGFMSALLKQSGLPNWAVSGKTYGLALDREKSLHLLHTIEISPMADAKDLLNLAQAGRRLLPGQHEFVFFNPLPTSACAQSFAARGGT